MYKGGNLIGAEDGIAFPPDWESMPLESLSKHFKSQSRKILFKHHPDHGGDKVKFQQLNVLFEVYRDDDTYVRSLFYFGQCKNPEEIEVLLKIFLWQEEIYRAANENGEQR